MIWTDVGLETFRRKLKTLLFNV